MSKGDIVLITFPFSDLSSSKLRPAAVLAETDEDLTVCFITAQMGRQERRSIAPIFKGGREFWDTPINSGNNHYPAGYGHPSRDAFGDFRRLAPRTIDH